MANNKVQLANGTVLIDITDTTANASDVLSGEYFYNASGVKTQGSLTIPSTYTITKTLNHVITNNDDTEVLVGGSFYMDLTLEAGYKYINSVTVTMNGVDITEQVFKAGVGEKIITQNGIYDAENDWVVGYSEVNVNVPNTYTSSDEGKVVSNGALVAQTSDTVTQNGIVDTTLINSLTVNVSGGSTPTGTKQINITQNGTVTEDVTNYANVEITTNVSGGSVVNSAFCVKDFKVPSAKWVINQGISNYIASGGCLHIKITIPTTTVSADSEVLSIGADALSAWSPSTNCSIFTAFYAKTGGGNNYSLRLRGSSVNGWFTVTQFADANNEVEIKIYSDKMVDVKTNTTYYYDSASDTGDLQFALLKTVMTNLCRYSYISVGCNQMSTRASGKIVSLFSIESE